MKLSLREAAVRYAVAGWAVFMLTPRDKMPLVSKAEGGNGCHDATSDTATVDAWWELHGTANIGLHCGPSSGVWVLDVDTKLPKPVSAAQKAAEAILGTDGIDRLEAAFGSLPRTLRSRSGSGGVHYFFRLPHGRTIKNRKGLMLPSGEFASIDVKSHGGYVVLPPSVHPSGTAYRWIEEIEPADAPEWLLDLVAPVEEERPAPEWNRRAPEPEHGPKRKYAMKALNSACEEIVGAKASGGNRHDVLNVKAFKVGGLVGGGYMDRETAESALIEAGMLAMAGEGRDEEVRRTVSQALTAGEARPISIPDPPARGQAPVYPEWDRTDEVPFDEEIPPPDDADAPPPAARRAAFHVLPPPEEGEPAPKPSRRRGPSLDELRHTAMTSGNAAIDTEREARLAGRPKILITHRQQEDILNDGWNALIRANKQGEPVLFTTSGRLTRIVPTEKGSAIALCNPSHVRKLLIESAVWRKHRKATKNDDLTSDGLVEVDAEQGPPKDIPDMIVNNPHPSLPVVEQIVYGPTFDKNGVLLDAPGYHPSALRWYAADAPLERVPMTVAEARDVLFDWVFDFPFRDGGEGADTGAASRANLIGLFLLPFVRDMIDGPTPVHAIEAAQPGTGKSLLAQVALLAPMGRAPTLQALPEREYDIHQTLSGLLFGGKQSIILDNVNVVVKSASLESAVTAKFYEARLLGRNETVEVPVRTIWILTMNNPQMGPDMARRSVRIRLVRLRDFDERTARHPDIKAFTLENRARLVSAGLTLVENWIMQGRQRGTARLAGFESWAATIGGILNAAGIEGFLGNSANFRKMADPISQEWADFADRWWSECKGEFRRTTDLLAIADKYGLLGDLTEGKNNRAMAFGKKLAAKVDSVMGPFQLRWRSSGGGGYVLVKIDAEGGAA